MTPRSPRPLRLAYLAEPNSVHTRRWLQFFADAGHDVHLLVATGAAIRPGLHSAVVVDRYERYWPVRLPIVSSLQGRTQLRRALNSIQPDVVHAHYLVGHGWQATLSGFHPRMVTPWGSDLFVDPNVSARARIWNRLTLRSADVVTVNSAHMRDSAVRAGARPDRVHEIQFGVDIDLFKPGDFDRDLRRRLRIPDGPMVFSMRALRPIYRHETILRALAAVPDASLVMTGRNADPEYRRQIDRVVEDLRLTQRVVLLEDISDDDLRALLRAAAMVVSIPASDGTPGSVLEALATGCPTIVSDLPTLREILGASHDDLLVPGRNADEVAAAMRRILSFPETERRQMGRQLRELILARFDYRTNMRAMEGLYEAVATPRRVRPGRSV